MSFNSFLIVSSNQVTSYDENDLLILDNAGINSLNLSVNSAGNGVVPQISGYYLIVFSAVGSADFTSLSLYITSDEYTGQIPNTIAQSAISIGDGNSQNQTQLFLNSIIYLPAGSSLSIINSSTDEISLETTSFSGYNNNTPVGTQNLQTTSINAVSNSSNISLLVLGLSNIPYISSSNLQTINGTFFGAQSIALGSACQFNNINSNSGILYNINDSSNNLISNGQMSNFIDPTTANADFIYLTPSINNNYNFSFLNASELTPTPYLAIYSMTVYIQGQKVVSGSSRAQRAAESKETYTAPIYAIGINLDGNVLEQSIYGCGITTNNGVAYVTILGFCIVNASYTNNIGLFNVGATNVGITSGFSEIPLYNTYNTDVSSSLSQVGNNVFLTLSKIPSKYCNFYTNISTGTSGNPISVNNGGIFKLLTNGPISSYNYSGDTYYDFLLDSEKGCIAYNGILTRTFLIMFSVTVYDVENDVVPPIALEQFIITGTPVLNTVQIKDPVLYYGNIIQDSICSQYVGYSNVNSYTIYGQYIHTFNPVKVDVQGVATWDSIGIISPPQIGDTTGAQATYSEETAFGNVNNTTLVAVQIA